MEMVPYLAWFFLVCALICFAISSIAYRTNQNRRKAKNIARVRDYGILVEHGMVVHGDSRDVTPDQKVSDYYVDTLTSS